MPVARPPPLHAVCWSAGSARAAAFELLPLHGDPAQDAFEYVAHGVTVRVSGTSAIALARGAYEHLRDHGGQQRA